jgi:glycosyltransferase involved in cell wall biosynthesis
MTDGSPAATSPPDPDAPRLSVLIPCWNAASTVERALSSVLDERDVALECVVIDDGSTDGTAEVVQAVAERDPRVVLLRLPSNAGVSNARNRGIEVARGDWLAFHDADDRMFPGGVAALMRPTSDPDVFAVIGQRVWSDGERTWLSPLYDIPDIRQPGRKSIATHPGLLYYASATGKAFHRSLLDDLRFEGRVVGDQAWTIRALLRAGGHIEVIGETVFEWSRPHPDRFVETITSIARASATGAVEMTMVARTVFVAVSAEVDALIEDEATREVIKHAYFERLLRSDLGGPVRKAIERHDPATGQLFDALTGFLDVVPRTILATSEVLITHLLRPPAKHWATLVRSARPNYWRMVRRVLRADPRMSGRIAWRRAVEPAFVFARVSPPVGPLAASTVLSVAVLAKRILDRLRRS